MIRKMGNILLFIAKTIMFAIVLTVFVAGQNLFYEQTLFYFWGNYIVLILYAAYLYFLCRIYQAFMIGSMGPSEIVLSWILCLSVANMLQYLILSLLEYKLLPVMGFVVVLVAQVAIIIPLTYLIDRAYYYLNPVQKTIIIYGNGETEKANDFRRIVESHRKKFEINQVVTQDNDIESLIALIEKADSAILVGLDENKRSALLEYCFSSNKRAYIMPSFSDIMINTAEITWISDIPMYMPKIPEQDMGTRFLKRCMDISISLLAIILFSWLMAIICVVIRLYDGNSAIYKQVRITRGGKLFTLYKFRSMRIDAESDGIPRLTTKDDDRVTPVGRFIRRTRLDELPQLFNVFLGSMSLVGPRPERPEIAKQYEEIYPNFSLRTKVKAGLTGFAQIHGRYNTEPGEKLLMDLMYIERFTIWQDCRLILQTLKVIFKPSSTDGVPNDRDTAL